jgi:hypothetical protein
MSHMYICREMSGFVGVCVPRDKMWEKESAARGFIISSKCSLFNYYVYGQITDHLWTNRHWKKSTQDIEIKKCVFFWIYVFVYLFITLAHTGIILECLLSKRKRYLIYVIQFSGQR